MSNNIIHKKVGIVACSGEDLVGGAIARAAVRVVMEFLRPDRTVVLCLPLLMAGDKERASGLEERNFTKDHPVIAIEGCVEACAAFAVDKYSIKPPEAVIRVDEILKEHPDWKPEGTRELNEDAMKVVEILANRIAAKVDELFGAKYEEMGFAPKFG